MLPLKVFEALFKLVLSVLILTYFPLYSIVLIAIDLYLSGGGRG